MYKFKAEHKGSTFRGKYCTRCNSVWELNLKSHHHIVGIVKHPDFPSFGLERQDCAECVATDPVDPPSTLGEEVAEQRKDLFKKEVERFNKEVERYNK